MFYTSLILRRRPADYKSSLLERDILSRMGKITSHLSLTRKQLLLFNWLEPLNAVLSLASPFSPNSRGGSQPSLPPVDRVLTPRIIAPTPKPKGFLHALLHTPPPVLLELVQATSDDIYTWSRIGLLGPKIGSRAARFSDWCWLFSTLVQMVENGVEKSIVGNLRGEVEGRLYKLSMENPNATNVKSGSTTKGTKHDEVELRRLQREAYWLDVGRLKLACDLCFVCASLRVIVSFLSTYYFRSLRPVPHTWTETIKEYDPDIGWFVQCSPQVTQHFTFVVLFLLIRPTALQNFTINRRPASSRLR